MDAKASRRKWPKSKKRSRQSFWPGNQPGLVWFAAAVITGFCGFGCVTAFADEPPSDEGTIEYSHTTGSELKQANQTLGRQSADVMSVELLQRHALPWTEWYWTYGVQAEAYTFHGGDDFTPRRLQDVAAQFAIEYYEKGEAVASVTVHPGFYFEERPSLAAWDLPVEAVSAVPLTESFSGVVGLLDARFYRHPIPVIGVVWTGSDVVRIEAVFPEPALVFTPNHRLEIKLAGELGGAGFRTTAHQTVEFSSYRVGINFAYREIPHWKLTASAGYELERTFDFLHTGMRARAGGAPYFKINLGYTH